MLRIKIEGSAGTVKRFIKMLCKSQGATSIYKMKNMYFSIPESFWHVGMYGTVCIGICDYTGQDVMDWECILYRSFHVVIEDDDFIYIKQRGEFEFSSCTRKHIDPPVYTAERNALDYEDDYDEDCNKLGDYEDLEMYELRIQVVK